MKHRTPYPWNSLIVVFNLLPSLGDPPPPLEVQQPTAMRARMGDAVTLTCTYPDQNERNAQVTWIRASQGPLSPLDDMNTDYVGRLTMSSLEENSRGAARLVISALTKNDSDTYFCMMESLGGASGKGNGTRLEVIDRRPLERFEAAPAAPTVSESRLAAPNRHHSASPNILTYLIIQSSLALILIFGGVLGCLISSYLPIAVRKDVIGDHPSDA